MSKVRIAHITTVDLSIRMLLMNQLRFLLAAGLEVSCISSAGPQVGAIEAAGLRHLPVRMTRRISPVADLVALFQLYRLLRRERFQLVHTHTPKAAFLGRLASRLSGVPVIVHTVHGFYFHEGASSRARRFHVGLERMAARWCELMISVSEEDVRTALDERICAEGKIRFLGNGIDLKAFDRSRLDGARLAELRRELGIPAGRPIVGFVGRLVREKGVADLLAAAATVRQRFPEVAFLIVGPVDDEKRDAVSPEDALGPGVSDLCVFTGMRDDLPELYALMDLFVLPSRREGFPRSVMEAAAMGLPCVVTDIRGCREIIRDRQNGLLVPPGDVPALAGAIVALLGDRAVAGRMGEANRRLALERFDERQVFWRLLQEYGRLLEAAGLSGESLPALPGEGA